MTVAVTVVDVPDLRATRCAFVLAEDRVGHYPEFRAFFDRTFDLTRVGLSRQCSSAPSRSSNSFGVEKTVRPTG